MPERRSAIALNEPINSEATQAINELRLGSRGTVDVLPPARLSLENPSLVQPPHDGHDRRVRMVPLVCLAKSVDDVRDARLPASSYLAQDRRGERA